MCPEIIVIYGKSVMPVNFGDYLVSWEMMGRRIEYRPIPQDGNPLGEHFEIRCAIAPRNRGLH